jgi:uncharacterized protein (DUF433 family)
VNLELSGLHSRKSQRELLRVFRDKRKEDEMDWQHRITVDPKVLVGKPVIKGTRIAVEFVVDLLAHGWTAAQILEEYDHLTAQDIQACLAYASEVLKSERVYLLPT